MRLIVRALVLLTVPLALSCAHVAGGSRDEEGGRNYALTVRSVVPWSGGHFIVAERDTSALTIWAPRCTESRIYCDVIAPGDTLVESLHPSDMTDWIARGEMTAMIINGVRVWTRGETIYESDDLCEDCVMPR